MDSTAWLAPLAGQTILVVEDEALISLDIEATLLEAGAEVIITGISIAAWRPPAIPD
ncbi:MAG: hypothetical protein WDN31_12870 [Hyphomicrobium sp.]